VEWEAAVVYNGNLRFCSHFLFTNIPYPQPTESLSRTPTLPPRVAHCENAFALERYKNRTSDQCESHEIYMSFTLQLVFVDVTVI